MDEDQYRSLATDYHWYFDDTALILGCDTPGVRAVMAGLPRGAAVLDAACGIGVDAVALARRGLDVTAADASPAMAEQARRLLRRAGLDRSAVVVESAWSDLPEHLPRSGFAAVFCVGNSIAHAAGPGPMVAALEVFRAVLAPGGVLVLDSYDWESIHAAGSRMMIEPNIVERDGTRCVRTYAWHVPPRFGEPCVLEIAPIFLDGDRAVLRSHPIRMYPFTRASLRERLSTAGFEAVALDAIPGDDRYTAVARRPRPAAG